VQRFLRDKTTRKFLSKDRTWGDLEHARHFEDTLELMRVALEFPEQPELELLIMFYEQPSGYDIIIPIRPPAESSHAFALPW